VPPSAFLVHFQTLCLRRAHKRFSFRNFSLGNGFLTGARDLFGSLPSAIFLFKSIAGVDPGVQVIPVINTNQTVTIAASLVNGSTIIGQCAISHPVEIAGSSPASNIGVPTPAHTPAFTTPSPTPFPFPFQPQAPEAFARKQAQAIHTGSSSSTPSLRTHFRRDSRTFDLDIQSPSEPASRSSLDGSPRIVVEEPEEKMGGNIGYRKGEEEIPLEARIERIFYINLYGQVSATQLIPISLSPRYCRAIRASLYCRIEGCRLTPSIGDLSRAKSRVPRRPRTEGYPSLLVWISLHLSHPLPRPPRSCFRHSHLPDPPRKGHLAYVPRHFVRNACLRLPACARRSLSDMTD
jgi:hypothetical protein